MSDYRENDRITVFEGDAKTLRFTVTDEEDGQGDPVNLTGFDITVTLYKREASSEKIFTKDTGSKGGVTITDAANGVFEVTVAGDDWTTDDIGPGYQRYYEAEGTDSGGNDQMVAVGTIDVLDNKD